MACRNILKLIGKKAFLVSEPLRCVKSPISAARQPLRLCHNVRHVDTKKCFYGKKTGVAVGVSLLTWLGFTREDENSKSELIMTLKRAVLCTQRQQYEKAEQMLHLALRLAQQQQNHQGVIYCYDLMANLALDTAQFEKAENLFIEVLRILLTDGVPIDDLKAVHISLKLARVAQFMGKQEAADMGYQWCLYLIQNKKNYDADTLMLYGIIHDWYAQFLLDTGDVSKAINHLKEAYNACQLTEGKNSEQTMLLLNDLGATSFRAGNSEDAESYLEEALVVGKDVEDKTYLGVVHANMGLVLVQKGITKEAEKYCKEARQLGKKHENKESVEQANYCFDQIKSALGK